MDATRPPPTLTVVLMGVSGSGKSTVMERMVERLAWPAAEADAFQPPANIAKMAAGTPLSDDDRWPWLGALAAWIGEREVAGEDAVVTCSALRRAYRDLLRAGHQSVRLVHLVVDDPVVLRGRILGRRGHFMPASLLGSQLDTLQDLAADEPGITVSGNLPPDRIVDEIERRLGILAT